MAAPTNIITTSDVNLALDRELVRNFTGDNDRLMEIMGIFGVEPMTAGQTLYQLTVTGSLNNAKTDASDLSGASGAVTLGSSSGTAYVEGDEVALSNYKVTKTPIERPDIVPYRKMTTAAAIQKSGYEVAVIQTDRKLAQQLRAQVISDFFTFIATGTGTSTAATTLQGCLANVDASLGDAMETNGDASDNVVHFVNRQDVAGYLGEHTITTETVFGMQYMQDFLGIPNVFVTNKVTAGTVWATPGDNVHVFALDFSELARGGLSYEQDADGLIGVAHAPAYDHVSVETNVLNGMLLFPEVKNYIVKGTFAPEA